MSDDPYKVLGVARDASQAEIKKAYRKLVKELHPDLHPGDKTKADRFQEVSAANDIIGDAETRKRFDAGEIDASGQERPERRYYRDFADADPHGRYDSGAGYGDFEDLSGIFSDLFGARTGAGTGRAQGFSARGADLRYHLDVDFMDAVQGAKRAVPLPDGSAIDLTIPAGVREARSCACAARGSRGWAAARRVTPMSRSACARTRFSRATETTSRSRCRSHSTRPFWGPRSRFRPCRAGCRWAFPKARHRASACD